MRVRLPSVGAVVGLVVLLVGGGASHAPPGRRLTAAASPAIHAAEGVVQVRPDILRSATLRMPPLIDLTIRRPPVAVPLGSLEETTSFALQPGQAAADLDFRVAATGAIEAEVSWTGPTRLRLTLAGPRSSNEVGERTGGEDAARTVEGDSPLRLSVPVSPADMAAGDRWRLLIERPAGNERGVTRLLRRARSARPVEGRVSLSYPALVEVRASPWLPWFFDRLAAALEGGSRADARWQRALREQGEARPLLDSALARYQRLEAARRSQLFGQATEIGDAVALHLDWSEDPALRSLREPRFTGYLPSTLHSDGGVILRGHNLTDAVGRGGLLFYSIDEEGRRRVLGLEEGVNLFRFSDLIVIDFRRFRPPLSANVTTPFGRRRVEAYDGRLPAGHYGVTAVTRAGAADIDFPVVESLGRRVRRARYRGRIDRVHCSDESNPEFWGSDEVYASVTTTRIEGTEVSSWTFHTPVEGGFDDDNRGHVRWPLLGQRRGAEASDIPVDLGDGTVLTVVLWEDDAGAPPEAVQDAIDFVATTVAAEFFSGTLTAGMGVAAGPGGLVTALAARLAAEAVAAILDWVMGALDDDLLGSAVIELDPRTAYLGLADSAELEEIDVGRQPWPYVGDCSWDDWGEPPPELHGCLEYSNDGDTGSYDLHYFIRLVPPAGGDS